MFSVTLFSAYVLASKNNHFKKEVGQDFNALLIHRGKVETENYWESLVCLQGCSP